MRKRKEEWFKWKTQEQNYNEIRANKKKIVKIKYILYCNSCNWKKIKIKIKWDSKTIFFPFTSLQKYMLRMRGLSPIIWIKSKILLNTSITLLVPFYSIGIFFKKKKQYFTSRKWQIVRGKFINENYKWPLRHFNKTC